MGKPRGKPKTCTVETQTDPYETVQDMSRDELIEIIQQMIAKEIEGVQSKATAITSETDKKLKTIENMMYEDKEILLGLEYNIETTLPEIKIEMNSVKDDLQRNSTQQVQQNDIMKSDIASNKSNLDVLEQAAKEKNVVIFGIPEAETESSTKDQLIHLSKEVLGLHDIKLSDIEETHRLGKPSIDSRPRKLLVKFRTCQKRNEFYNRRKKTPISEDVSANIYINEDLTLYRSKLFYDARKLVKRKRLHSAWTQRGNIMVRQNEQDKPVAVYNHEQLREVYKTTSEQYLDSNSGQGSQSAFDYSSSEDGQ